MSLFDLFPLMIGTPDGARALSQAELNNLAIANARLAVNAERNADYWEGLANYRPPVYIPAGWLDWFSIGDELR